MTTLGLWDRLRHALGHYPSTAREWAVRVQSADVARHELLALDEWLKADPRNAEDYARVNKIAHLGLKLRDYPQERARLAGYAKLRSPSPLGEGRGEGRASGRRWRLVTAGAAAGVVVALAVLLASDLSALSGRYAAGRGEQRQVVLEDGSRIVVNTDSEVAVRFHEFERSVQLVRGEAFFEVAKDAARPFVVRTGSAEVRAVGTKFSVRRNDSDTEVVVTEGRVRVVREGKSDNQAPAASPIELVPGNLVHVSSTAPTAQIAVVDVARATAWTAGNVEFEEATLAEVIRDVNRYTTKEFVIADPSLAEIRVTGRFRVGDVESVKFALQNRFDIDAAEEKGLIRLSRSR